MAVVHNAYHLIPTPKKISQPSVTFSGDQPSERASFPLTNAGVGSLASPLTKGGLRGVSPQNSSSFVVGLQTEIDIRLSDNRIHKAVRTWRAGFSPTTNTQVANDVNNSIVIVVDACRVEQREGYSLRVTPKHIELIGGSAAGCFLGLQTLKQLSNFETGEIFSVEITDWPDFAVRGLLHDITRGEVPTLATLKQLVDRLALLKINHLQLYIEHAFVFSFDKNICSEAQGITPDEVRELSLYCRDRFIELVPAVANLGHMGRILSLPQYRHLAAVPATAPWEQQSWPVRARGLTLDCANPRAKQLVDNIWSDIFEAFDSSIVNICGDEPWDLGKRKGLPDVDQDELETLYLSHIRLVHSLCEQHGRRAMLWSDVVREHSSRLSELPADLTLLHWGYDDQADYAGTASLVETGLPTWICPGTTGWKRIINAMGLAERNISTFARVGLSHGATGLLNTDWGDHGHFNSLACSWHGISLGAACAWNTSQKIGSEFDLGFAHHVLRFEDADGVKLLHDASVIADQHETWRLMWLPDDQVLDSELPDMEMLERAQQAANNAATWWQNAVVRAVDDTIERDEIATACCFSQLLAEKLQRLHRSSNTPATSNSNQPSNEDWRERLRQATDRYAANWNKRNKSSGLADILQALNQVATDEMKIN